MFASEMLGEIKVFKKTKMYLNVGKKMNLLIQIHNIQISLVIILFSFTCGKGFSEVVKGSPVNSVHYGSRWIKLKNSLGEDLILTEKNAIAVGVSPSNFDWHDWSVCALVVGATGIAFFGDQPVRTMIKAHQSSTVKHFLHLGVVYGSVFTAVGVGGSMYLAGLGFSRPWLHETGREVLTSVALAEITTGVLKVVSGRTRPYVNEGPYKFHFIGKNNSSWSFPSGHSTAAFSVSTVLAARISNPYATIGLYVVSSLAAAQRIYSDNHWLSDVILGAAIGTAVGHIVVKNSSELKKISHKNWKVVPEFYSSGAGVIWIRSF